MLFSLLLMNASLFGVSSANDGNPPLTPEQEQFYQAIQQVTPQAAQHAAILNIIQQMLSPKKSNTVLGAMKDGIIQNFAAIPTQFITGLALSASIVGLTKLWKEAKRLIPLINNNQKTTESKAKLLQLQAQLAETRLNHARAMAHEVRNNKEEQKEANEEIKKAWEAYKIASDKAQKAAEEAAENFDEDESKIAQIFNIPFKIK